MNYRSIADLSNTIRENLYKIPCDVDLIVGIPRSGMLAANILALNLNLKFCDLNSYINDSPLEHGRTRKPRQSDISHPSEACHVLVVDDSICTGKSMSIARQKIDQCGWKTKVTYCGVYVAPESIFQADLVMDILDSDRSFEWNTMHLPDLLLTCCVDIDGVLCVDPTNEQNDDGPAYLEFLTNAKPLVLPSYPIGHLVTSRLEKYRYQTECWLARHGVEYKNLYMLDLPDADTRRRLNCHASFKAGIYRKLYDTTLFIESERFQAMQIVRLSGKQVLSFSSQELFKPGLSYALIEQKSRKLLSRAVGKLYRIGKKLLATTNLPSFR